MSSRRFQEANLYRLLRSLSGYCSSMNFSEAAESALAAGNLPWAASASYYAGFHLAGAVLYLDMKLPYNHKEIVSPKGTNISGLRRFLQIGHEQLIRSVDSIKEEQPFLVSLVRHLQVSRELRELAQYGPYLQLTRPTEVSLGRKVTIHPRPLYLKEHASIDASNPSSFTTIPKMIETRVILARELVDGFPDFFRQSIGGYDVVELRIVFAILPAVLAIFVYPPAAEDIDKRSLSRLRKLVELVDPVSTQYFDRGKTNFYNPLSTKIRDGHIPGELSLEVDFGGLLQQ